jgi:hypothetical protein
MFSGKDWPIVIFDWYSVVVVVVMMMMMMVDFLLVMITETKMFCRVF